VNPYIHINFACSIDGKIALEGGVPYKFSNLLDLQRVHRLRSESNAILVGINTINNDDPKLVVNPKYFESSNVPDAIVLDSKFRINGSARIFNYKRKVIIITGIDAPDRPLPGNSAAKIIIKRCDSIRPDIECLIRIINEMRYTKVLVEGGKGVLTSFINSDFWDEITIFYSPVLVGDKGISMIESIDKVIRTSIVDVKKLGDGFLLTIKR